VRFTGKPELKITDIQPFLVDVGRTLVYVKVSTDAGIYRLGRSLFLRTGSGYCRHYHRLKEWLVGKDPRNVEYLWATMYNFTRFPGGMVVNAAISGIEHALWDIAAKRPACRSTC